MKCEICRGACCAEFAIYRSDLKLPSADVLRWLTLHGTEDQGALRFEGKCSALTSEGRCGIYDVRPLVCRVFQPGGSDCLDTVRRRRTPEQYAQIREAHDPEAIHG